jgi:hypothetical protein
MNLMRSTDSGPRKSFNGSTRKSTDAFAQNAFLRSSSNEAKARNGPLAVDARTQPWSKNSTLLSTSVKRRVFENPQHAGDLGLG